MLKDWDQGLDMNKGLTGIDIIKFNNFRIMYQMDLVQSGMSI